MQPKRYHPLTLIINLWNYIRGAAIPALFLFVLNLDSESFIWKYGRYAFVIITLLTLCNYILKWLFNRYELKNHAFHLYSGIFNKEEQIVAFQKIQNINRKTTFIHRIFHMTSIHFETAMSGDNATVHFEAITKKEADDMVAFIESSNDQTELEETIASSEVEVDMEKTSTTSERTVHFTPTGRDTIRASFTSFSFLILVPIIFSIYTKISTISSVEERTEGFISSLLNTWWVMIIVIVLAILLSMLIGILRIYFKYGKYEISSDNEQIYIKQGVLNEAAFSIKKKNVQAIEMEQSFIKRLLGIVEIKLISAGGLSTADDNVEVSSLYPFLKKQRAYSILAEILPAYQITEEMTKLTRIALWLGLLKGSLFYLVPAGFLIYFKPEILGIKEAWWLIIIFLFVLINGGILLSYLNRAYAMNDAFIQIKKGALGSSLFLSKREKVIEVNISRSFVQKRLGVASLEIVNRAQPVQHTTVTNVSENTAAYFYHWYKRRIAEIELDHN